MNVLWRIFLTVESLNSSSFMEHQALNIKHYVAKAVEDPESKVNKGINTVLVGFLTTEGQFLRNV